MAHSNITNFTNFLEKFQGVTDPETEIKNPPMTSGQKAAFGSHLLLPLPLW